MLALAAVAPLWLGLSALVDDRAPVEEDDDPLGERFHMPAVLLLAVAIPLAMAAVCLVVKAVIGDGDDAAPLGRRRCAGSSEEGWRRGRDFGTGR